MHRLRKSLVICCFGHAVEDFTIHLTSGFKNIGIAHSCIVLQALQLPLLISSSKLQQIKQHEDKVNSP